ncbi:DUF3284 domain-containing protein [Streptococcus sp. 20-1249]|uniref:DUF3284 domain-containing protein n=1 Tax=Streptococcus hepaticus TaxID=3349163 RepID=UPI003747CF29
MQVSKIYPTRAKPVFDLLTKLFIEDYETSTGQSISADEIVSGLTYIKKIGQQGSVNLQVLEFQPPESYRVEISSSRGKQMLHYLLEEIDSEQVKITYSELNESPSFFNSWNYKLLKPFFKKKLETRMVLQIDKLVEFSQSSFMKK